MAEIVISFHNVKQHYSICTAAFHNDKGIVKFSAVADISEKFTYRFTRTNQILDILRYYSGALRGLINLELPIIKLERD